MRFKFDNKDLEELYTFNKHIRNYPEGVIKGFFKAMMYINASVNLRDLSKFKGLNLEKLSGKRKEQYSLRLNDQHRLIFIITKLNELLIKNIEDYLSTR
jgi:toxin HigB-1